MRYTIFYNQHELSNGLYLWTGVKVDLFTQIELILESETIAKAAMAAIAIVL